MVGFRADSDITGPVLSRMRCSQATPFACASKTAMLRMEDTTGTNRPSVRLFGSLWLAGNALSCVAVVQVPHIRALTPDPGEPANSRHQLSPARRNASPMMCSRSARSLVDCGTQNRCRTVTCIGLRVRLSGTGGEAQLRSKPSATVSKAAYNLRRSKGKREPLRDAVDVNPKNISATCWKSPCITPAGVPVSTGGNRLPVHNEPSWRIPVGEMRPVAPAT